MRSLPRSAFSVVLALGALVLLSGCSQQMGTSSLPRLKQGVVHGGQQPVVGATIQLYAVGATGDGSPATPLLTHAVTTDANGQFTLTGDYTCPAPGSLVYLVATGGNPGLAAGTNNAALALMSALGSCGNLTSSTFINVNELTTVAAVWPLAPFMSSYSGIGASTLNAGLLPNAFGLAAVFADTSTGAVPGATVPAGTSVPVTQIDTIADILSTCVNSAGGVAGDGSACGRLLSAATPSGGTAPTNVIAAALNIANNPTSNVSNLFALLSPTPPFQPVATAPPADYSVRLQASSPGLTASPSTLTFPNTYIGFPATQTLTFTNAGTSTLQLIRVDTAGPDVGDFSFAPTSVGCPGLLYPGQSCSFDLTFTPSVSGPRNATFLFTYGSGTSPLTVGMSGAGTALSGGPVTLSPSSLTFTLAGVPQTVTVTNSGSTDVAIGQVSVSDPGHGYFEQTNNCGTVLAAQSICNIFVDANFLSGSSDAGTLKLVDSAASGTQTIPITISASTVQFSSSPITFGSWALGVTSQIQTRTVFSSGNIHTNPISVTSSLTGPNAGDFSTAGSGTGAFPGVYNLDVTFTPTGIGPRTATLATNYGNITLSGVGAPAGAVLAVSPSSLTGSSKLNVNSGIGSVTVQNHGTTPLTLTPTVTGPNASDFSATNQCPGSLATAASCTMSISFTPTQFGVRTATLIVTDTTSGAQQTAALSGIGSPNPPAATPTSLTFANTDLGTTSAAQTFTVTAPNNDPVTVTIDQNAYDPADFKVAAGTCATQTPCQVSVTFAPTALGSRTGGIFLTDAVTLGLMEYYVYGTGGVAKVSLSTPSLTFAARNQGTTSIPQTITLTNTGDVPLAISAVMFIGANTGDFSLQGNTCGSSVAAGANCAISVSFAPTASGARSASLEILSNAASSPDTVALSGTGN